jgi:hypothetical protein
MRYLITILLLAAVGAASVSAAGIMNVRSNLKSEVYLNDQRLGSTPLTISEIPRGDHVLKLVEPNSDNTKRLYFRIPNHVDVQKDIDVEFYPNDPANSVLRADGSEASHENMKPTRHYRHVPAPRKRDNSKVRIRNTALGVGALGLLTGSGPLKVIGLGGALVNELVHK